MLMTMNLNWVFIFFIFMYCYCFYCITYKLFSVYKLFAIIMFVNTNVIFFSYNIWFFGGSFLFFISFFIYSYVNVKSSENKSNIWWSLFKVLWKSRMTNLFKSILFFIKNFSIM